VQASTQTIIGGVIPNVQAVRTPAEPSAAQKLPLQREENTDAALDLAFATAFTQASVAEAPLASTDEGRVAVLPSEPSNATPPEIVPEPAPTSVVDAAERITTHMPLATPVEARRSQPELAPSIAAVEDRPSTAEERKFFDSTPIESGTLEGTSVDECAAIEFQAPIAPRPHARGRQLKIVAAALGICSFIGIAAGLRALRTKPAPVAATSTTLAATPAVPAKNATTTQHRAPAPAKAALAAAVAHDSDSVAVPADLNAAADSSESPAPSCDTLLAQTNEPYADPAVAYAALRDGHRQLVRGNYDASQTAFCKAVRWEKANANMFLDLAQLMLLRRDAAAAVTYAQRAVELDSNKRSQQLLGDALIRSGKTSEARTAWLTANGIAADNARGVKALIQNELIEGQRALKQRDYARAERLFRRVAAFETSAPAFAGMARALLHLGHKQAAFAWIAKAQAADPNDALVQQAAEEVRSAPAR
jgi:hypothetical protein